MNSSQFEMPLLVNVKHERENVSYEHAKMCKTEQEAMRLCISESRVFITRADVAASLGYNEGTFNTILNSDRNNRPRYMPRAAQERLQELCGNNAVNQWAELYSKGLLNCQQSIDSRKAELEKELAALQKLQE